MIKKILNIFKRKSNTNSIISGCNGRLIINGEVIADNINPHGKISIIDNKIMLDGKEINTQGTELKHSFRPTVNITIEGNAGYIECNGNVTVKGDVDGNIDCGGSVTVSGNVHNKVDSGGSVYQAGR